MLKSPKATKDPLIFFIFALLAGVVAIIFGVLVLIFDHTIWLLSVGEFFTVGSLLWLWGYDQGDKHHVHQISSFDIYIKDQSTKEPLLNLDDTDHIDTHM